MMGELPSLGFYGKLASRGDFVQRGLPRSFVEPWDAWLADGLAQSQAELGSAWLDAYLTSPLWRFALSAGLVGPAPVFGVVMPSVDRVGRYFPLTVAVVVAPDCDLAALIAGPDDWFERCEEALLATLGEDGELDQFEATLQTLGLPPLATRCAPTVLQSGLVRLSGNEPAARGAALMQNALDGMSFWWGSGSERIAASLLRASGMPSTAQFGLLLAGEAHGTALAAMEQGGAEWQLNL